MGMNRKRFAELVEEKSGKYKDFSQSIYMKRYGSPEAVRKGMCRALAAAYIAKNHDRALGKSGNAATDDFSTADFTRDLMSESFFTALAGGRPTIKAMTYKSAEDKDRHRFRFQVLADIHVKSKSADDASMGPSLRIEAERLTVQTAVQMVSAGRMSFVSEVPIDPSIGVSTNHFPDRQGFWIISAMGHVIAVCFRSGPKAKVFEPNFGQGVFESYDSCREFLTALMSEDDFYKQDAQLFAKEFAS